MWHYVAPSWPQCHRRSAHYEQLQVEHSGDEPAWWRLIILVYVSNSNRVISRGGGFLW